MLSIAMSKPLYHATFFDGYSFHGEPKHPHFIFTTIRIIEGKLIFWEWHEERLLRDSAQIGVRWESSRYPFLCDVAADIDLGALRISCTQNGWWVHTWKSSMKEDTALKTAWIQWEHTAPLPAFSKHGYRKRAQELQETLHVDVLLWYDSSHYVLEASIGSLFRIEQDIVYTPPLDGRILPGIGRRWLFTIAKDLGILIQETNLNWKQKGWWMTSALRSMQKLDVSSENLSQTESILLHALRDSNRMLSF